MPARISRENSQFQKVHAPLCSPKHYSQQPRREVTSVSINRVDKGDVVHTCRGILFSREKE